MATVSLGKKEHTKAYTEVLKSLMEAADIASYRALATQSGVSRWQVQQLRVGAIARMRVAVVSSLAEALNVSIHELLSQFGIENDRPKDAPDVGTGVDSALRQEYARLQRQMTEQMEIARSQFQSEALQTLETWLTQWPTIAKRAKDRGKDVPAVNILPFVKPVEALMAEWGVAVIAPVDAQVPYDPTLHQLKGGIAEPGEFVRVTHTGSLYKGNLLHRAEVKKLRPN